MITQAIILAGGQGTRLRQSVPHLPKPMAPVSGRPFLERQMDYWLAQGVRRFILSVGYKRDVIMAHFGSRYRDAEVDYAQETAPLGTGGGLLLAASMIDSREPFLAMNGDCFFEVALADLQRHHYASRSQWTLALMRADMANRYGKVAYGAGGRVASFCVTRAKTGELANGGVYLMEKSALAHLPFKAGDTASLESQLLPECMARGGRVYGMLCAGRLIDIGLPADYTRAQQLFRK